MHAIIAVQFRKVFAIFILPQVAARLKPTPLLHNLSGKQLKQDFPSKQKGQKFKISLC